MKQQILYRYLGANGIISSPIYLEGAHGIKIIKAQADEGKILKNIITQEEKMRILIPFEQINEWTEITKES